MLRHYIKMAMRHLLKNKIQNLISIVGAIRRDIMF